MSKNDEIKAILAKHSGPAERVYLTKVYNEWMVIVRTMQLGTPNYKYALALTEEEARDALVSGLLSCPYQDITEYLTSGAPARSSSGSRSE